MTLAALIVLTVLFLVAYFGYNGVNGDPGIETASRVLLRIIFTVIGVLAATAMLLVYFIA